MQINEQDQWYVLQVISNREEKVVQFLSKLELKNFSPYIPKKILKEKKRGITINIVKPLYPGYIFIVGKWDLEDAKKSVKVPGAVKFIGGLQTPGHLTKSEKELINKITKDGGVAGLSKVIKEGSKIKIVSGPLKELEGEIISVDRRKQKAIAKVTLLNSVVKVTLAFEYIDVSEENKL